MKKKITIEEAIAAFGKTLQSKKSRSAVFEQSLKSLVRFFDAERGLILEVGGKKDLLIRALHRLEEKTLFESGAISGTVLTEVRKKKKAVITEDAVFDPRFDEQRSVIISGLRSIICAPIVHQKKLLGIVYIDHRGKEGLFTNEHLQDLRKFLAELKKFMLRG